MLNRPDWNEEQLRYRVLDGVYRHAGATCDREVTGPQIGTELHLRFEDLFRVIHFLEYHGYLLYLGAGPRVRISPKGIEYIEELAGRRRSIRTPEIQLVSRNFSFSPSHSPT